MHCHWSQPLACPHAQVSIHHQQQHVGLMDMLVVTVPWGIGYNPRVEGVQCQCWLRRGSERLVGIPAWEDQTFHHTDGLVDVETVEAEVVFEVLGDLCQMELAVVVVVAAVVVVIQVLC